MPTPMPNSFMRAWRAIGTDRIHRTLFPSLRSGRPFKSDFPIKKQYTPEGQHKVSSRDLLPILSFRESIVMCGSRRAGNQQQSTGLARDLSRIIFTKIIKCKNGLTFNIC